MAILPPARVYSNSEMNGCRLDMDRLRINRFRMTADSKNKYDIIDIAYKHTN